MVADKGDDPAAGARRLALKAHQIADDLERVRPAIGNIAELDKNGCAAGPVATSIDQAGIARDIAPGRVVAVEIADGNDSQRHAGDGFGSGSGRTQADDKERCCHEQPQPQQICADHAPPSATWNWTRRPNSCQRAAMTKIMIIRHAEKPRQGRQDRSVCIDGFHAKHELTVRGWQRAAALVHFFAPRNGEPHHPHIEKPSAIFAAAVTDASPSLRSQRTVEPMADALGLAIDTSFAEGEEAALAAAVLRAPSPVLIAWHHHKIAPLARLICEGLQCPDDWPDDRFDMVWVLDLAEPAEMPGDPGTGRWQFSQVPQLLFPHDLSDPF
jgi:hypothetical protein